MSKVYIVTVRGYVEKVFSDYQAALAFAADINSVEGEHASVESWYVSQPSADRAAL